MLKDKAQASEFLSDKDFCREKVLNAEKYLPKAYITQVQDYVEQMGYIRPNYNRVHSVKNLRTYDRIIAIAIEKVAADNKVEQEKQAKQLV